ncbi:ATP-binding SpoIIE family protein phosphatase [Variovorax sp. KK3]|uniref:ATP-binding SpoIIE family protein phosphatase n=1 Tax=Variovorax sp. KK3 TaxID=1855728 RepID=UPI00097C4BFA|nr:ATP-binding SpoIIE family protein phosphatase [Variovorax sp. KK3]
MEVIAGWTHRAFVIEDASCVGEARRHVARLCSERDWPEVDAARAAIVATELGTNLAKHAQKGQLLVAARDPFGDIEILSVDGGPGIADLPRAMRDGVSTRSTPGSGLGAIARQSDFFDIHSAPDQGTTCVARIAPASRAPAAPTARGGAAYAFGAVCVPVRGETVCGDGWCVAFDGERAAALLADGLGHGPDAAVASQEAVRCFAERPFADARESLPPMHEALRTTRGAAVFAMRVGAGDVAYAGAGNVLGRVVSGTFDKSLLTPHGTLGLQARRFEAMRMPLPLHATVILHSDGVVSRWDAGGLGPLLHRDPVLLAARIYADFSRGRDDVCILALRPTPSP